MKILQKLNIAAIIAVLWTFCFVAALSSDTTVSLRGSDSNGNRRNLQYQKISVFRCDSENRTITSTISNKTEDVEEDGLDIRICFQVSPKASADNLAILKIDDFTFTKDRVNGDLAAAGPTRQIPVIMRQNAVDHGVAMSTDLTKIYCSPGSDICAIETRLTGYFFLTNGIIKGKGSVAMQRGRDEGRELQQMDGFEDVSIDLEFTGGGSNGIPPETRTIIIIIGIILGLIVLCCLCGFLCCIFGFCCFAARNKKETEESEEENIEEVSVKIEWEPTAAKDSKKNDEDNSETESLEDDKYWDDEVGLSDDESEDGDLSECNSVEDFDNEMNGAAAVPVLETEEESPKKESKRKSKNRSVEDNESSIDNYEDGIKPVDRSVENLDIENNMEEVAPVEDAEEEVVPVEDTEEDPPKTKKSKKKKKSKRID